MLAAQSETTLDVRRGARALGGRAREGPRRGRGRSRVVEDELGIANVLAAEGRAEERGRNTTTRLRVSRKPGRETRGSRSIWASATPGRNRTPTSARFYYEKALSVLEETRSSLGGAEVRVGYLGGTRRRYYEEGSPVLRLFARGNGGSGKAARAEAGGAHEAAGPGRRSRQVSSLAFETVERAKARGLLDLLETVRSPRPGLPPRTRARFALPAGSGIARFPERAAPARRPLFGASRSAPPGFGGADWFEAVGCRPRRAPEAHPKDAALLAYALGDTCSLLWVVDRKGHDLVELPNRAALAPEVVRLRDALTKPGAGDAAVKSAARSLFKILVEPASARLAKKETLVIVPDGFSFEIPYESSADGRRSRRAGWGDLPFLARSYTTLYAPSASVYASPRRGESVPELRSRPFRAGRSGLHGPRAGAGDASRSSGRAARRSPVSRKEVERIADRPHQNEAEILVGAAASETALREVSKRVPRGSSTVRRTRAHRSR